MNKLYRKTETLFEKFVSNAIYALGNSITFILAVCTVIFFLSNKKMYTQDIHQSIGDIILSITFLSLFMIQKSSNRFSAALHLKLNELIASNDSASNAVLNIEEKTEHELTELTKEYAELSKEFAEIAEQTKEAAELAEQTNEEIKAMDHSAVHKEKELAKE